MHFLFVGVALSFPQDVTNHVKKLAIEARRQLSLRLHQIQILPAEACELGSLMRGSLYSVDPGPGTAEGV